ncbi:hypothetical protein EDI_183650 [Entamoeba dispar SAW760]|uniref:Transmembrane protein n=1 Tax=Entamoeba dispar (strain ATCC PRA-260 / SAW760) TaxID=370354 RepID=B0E6Q4_ENTDS|nr:uncharacterized protein EDI_183650 [Entamoeba dispar SAW760]EDR29786.1 hypothetical protein EDI_183650 [Entamoeba dispar SAW760]|eukprot:EDR29786.1 hypothetical protein EDI_183650 [Entamoeba dispar SAW760]
MYFEFKILAISQYHFYSFQFLISQIFHYFFATTILKRSISLIGIRYFYQKLFNLIYPRMFQFFHLIIYSTYSSVNLLISSFIFIYYVISSINTLFIICFFFLLYFFLNDMYFILFEILLFVVYDLFSNIHQQ